MLYILYSRVWLSDLILCNFLIIPEIYSKMQYSGSDTACNLIKKTQLSSKNVVCKMYNICLQNAVEWK